MIRAPITFSLRSPPVVWMLAIALLVAGGVEMLLKPHEAARNKH
jgi:hypothetical protein